MRTNEVLQHYDEIERAIPDENSMARAARRLTMLADLREATLRNLALLERLLQDIDDLLARYRAGTTNGS